MFTGLVEIAAPLVSCSQKEDGGYRLCLRRPKLLDDLTLGDSVAVNGCCLTVVEITDGTLAFDLLAETLRRTSLDALGAGSRVNLERSLRADARLGGHFVSGHIDDTGEVVEARREGADLYLRISVTEEGRKYLIPKGSIALDGVSLTLADLHEDGFAVWLIPHTCEVTNLGERKKGDRMNLEFDLLGKYVERLLAAGVDSPWVRKP